LKWFIALDLFLVRMMTLKRSGKDLKINGYLDLSRYLPWYPISRLLRIDSLIVLVVSEVLEAIQDHDDSSLAVTAAGTVSLTMLLWLI
jgi:hypothetical protein